MPDAAVYEQIKKVCLQDARGRIKPLRLCSIDEAIVEMQIDAIAISKLWETVTHPTYPFPVTNIYYSTHWDKTKWQRALNRLQRLPDDSPRKKQYDHNIIRQLAAFLELDYEPSKPL